MASVIYVQDISAPARAVLLTAEALGISLEKRVIDLITREQRKPEFIKINPQHTIPTLVEEDGFTVWDSHAINAYLVTKYGKDDSLYPKDPKTRALADQRLHFDTGVLFASLRNMAGSVFFRGATTFEEYMKDNIVEAYGFLETFLQDSDFLVGNRLTIADLNAVATVTTLDILVPIDATKFPKIIAWIKRLQVLPYYHKIQDNGLEDFRKLFEHIPR